MSKRGGRLLFVNEKQQKTFFTRAMLVPAPQAQRNKRFLRRFFPKKRLPSVSTQAYRGDEIVHVRPTGASAAVR
jgi:hypothetical protein